MDVANVFGYNRGYTKGVSYDQSQHMTSAIYRVATMNSPWLGWPAELTCDLGATPQPDGNYTVHMRVGTLWCWLFLWLTCAMLVRLVRR